MKTQHTPTPWIVRRQELDENMRQIRRESVDGLSSVIATIHNETICDEHGGNAISNAAFIVRAVNAHEELLLIIKFAKQLIRSNMNYEEVISLQGEIADATAKAIAKAEGR